VIDVSGAVAVRQELALQTAFDGGPAAPQPVVSRPLVRVTSQCFRHGSCSNVRLGRYSALPKAPSDLVRLLTVWCKP
jgi:hypothetical protein